MSSTSQVRVVVHPGQSAQLPVVEVVEQDLVEDRADHVDRALLALQVLGLLARAVRDEQPAAVVAPARVEQDRLLALDEVLVRVSAR